MALAGMTYVTVTGMARKGDDNPEVGEILFAREVTISSSSQDIVSPPWTYPAQLQPDGSFSISLPTTDDPDWFPAYTYLVTERYSSGTRSYRIALPANTPGGTVNIADLGPVAVSESQESYVLTSMLGEPGGVATLGPDGLLSTEQRPTGGGGTGGGADPSNSVASETTYGIAASAGVSAAFARGDHTHGTPPVPTAAQVGADPAGTASGAVTAHVAAADPHGDRAYSDSQLTAGLATKAPVAHTHGTSSIIFEWYIDTATSGSGLLRRFNDTGATLTIKAFRARANILAPTGGSGLTFDLNLNGTTVWTTQANRPVIASGGTDTGKVTNMEVITVPDGAYLTLDLDTVGSTVPGSGVLVQVVLQ